MMFGTSTLFAVGFALAAEAHLFIQSPTPIEGSAPKDPLSADGSNFPCHGVTLPGAGGQSMPVGSSQLLQFNVGEGANTAVHGGGSCQISITYETDAEKIKDPSAWKVIYSIEEGCPTNSPANLDGQYTGPEGSYQGALQCNDPKSNGYDCVNQFNFTIPEGVKNGQATLAWTWFNNVGNREIYMNCAAIDITGGADDSSAMSSLPDMFVANLNGNGLDTCSTDAYSNVKFPDPGEYVTTKTATSNVAISSPTMSYPIAVPSGCSSAAGSSGSGSSGSSSSPAAYSASATAALSISLGISLGEAERTSAAAAASTTLMTYASAVPTSSVAASSAPAVISTAATAAAAASAAPSSGSSLSSNGSCAESSVSCSTPGSVICIGTTQFGLCNIDYCAVPEALAAGTSCSGGVISKRDVVRRSTPRHRHFARGAHRRSF